MYIQFAAHVDCPITHESITWTLVLGIAAGVAGAAVAITVAIVTAPVSVPVTLGAAALTGASWGGAGISAGMKVGAFADSHAPVSVVGVITSGYPKLRLGPQSKPAARANSDDTLTGCDHTQILEGSKLVMVGSEFKPLSRAADRTKCPGKGAIADGLHTVLVGGLPSMDGLKFDGGTPLSVKLLSLLGSALGVANPIKEGQLATISAAGIEMTCTTVGDEKCATVAGAAGVGLDYFKK